MIGRYPRGYCLRVKLIIETVRIITHAVPTPCIPEMSPGTTYVCTPKPRAPANSAVSGVEGNT